MLDAKVGARDGREEQTTAGITVSDAVTGAATGSGSYVPREDNNESATAGIRIKLEGGGMSHEINAGAAVSWQLNRNAYDFDLVGYATNLYDPVVARSEEHTSELQSLMRISYAVFCLKKKT